MRKRRAQIPDISRHSIKWNWLLPFREKEGRHVIDWKPIQGKGRKHLFFFYGESFRNDGKNMQKAGILIKNKNYH